MRILNEKHFFLRILNLIRNIFDVRHNIRSVITSSVVISLIIDELQIINNLGNQKCNFALQATFFQ